MEPGRDLRELQQTLASLGADPDVFHDIQVAHMAASGHHVVSQRDIPGVTIQADETDEGIINAITIEPGVQIHFPIHLCIGIFEKTGVQRIQTKLTVKEGSSASFLAHCLFPHVESGQHRMEASIEILEGATVTYQETHFQGPFGGMTVMPQAVVKVGKMGRYISDFSLTTGRVGKLAIDYVVQVDQGGIAELTARVFGRGNDVLTIKENVILEGEDSRGLIKTRVALEEEATAELTGIMDAHAKGARGHVDCREIVRDKAVARAVPIVNVTHPLAKVTHEAAIGSVDQKELETLLARGLDPDLAIELIVSGMLQ